MEADGLRWALLVIGSLVIVGLAIHGIWLSRKNNEQKTNTSQSKKEQEYQPSAWQGDSDGFDEDVDDAADIEPTIKFEVGNDDEREQETDESFEATSTIKNEYDDLGLGAVRVVSNKPENDTAPDIKEAEHVTEQAPTPSLQPDPEEAQSKIYASVVTQPKPEYAGEYTSLAAQTVAISQQEKAKIITKNESESINKTDSPVEASHAKKPIDNYQAPEPPASLMKKEMLEPQNNIDSQGSEQTAKDTHSNTSSVEKLSMSEQARKLVKRKQAAPVKERREPKIAEDQMRIDFDEQINEEQKLNEEVKDKPAKQAMQQEVLVLNVKSQDDSPIPGAALLPMLLTLGFKFGEQDIFHRHVNASGKGPVLFSLANMFKPGNFDIDNLENFTTQGISLFMILPIEGDPHQVFNMMHNAARKIADEFSAQIYDGKRTLLTKQSLQQYVEKIREFERQR